MFNIFKRLFTGRGDVITRSEVVPGAEFVLNRDINSFFSKGTSVTIISHWGDTGVYVSNGLHRVIVYLNELSR